MGMSSEAEILRRVRNGDVATYGVLYERHLGAARRLARSLLADRSDADDVVAEVFAATFAAMRKGRGPADDFRPYMLTAVRRECQRTWRRGGRQRPGGEQVIDLAAARAGDRDEIEQHTEDEVVHRAFAALPPHMREVLWASEVQNQSHADIAARTGSTSAAVAQLIVRARRLLGERYLDAHLPGTGAPLPATCVATRRLLAEVVRGTASATQRTFADSHLASCPSCVAASDHLRVVNHRLRTGHVLALAPVVTASKPVRLGVLARLFAWLFGSAPVITASVTLVLVAAIAPEAARHVDASAPAPTPVVVVRDEHPATPPSHDLDDPANSRPTAPTVSTAPAASTPTAGAVAGPEVVPGATAPVTPPPADAADTGGALGAVPETLGTVVPASGLGAPIDAVTDAAEQTVNGLDVDDHLVDAAQPLLDALPPTQADVQVAPVPLGPLGVTPPLAVQADAGGGTLGVSATAGDAHVAASVGGPGGAQVSLPSTADVATALPAPVTNLVSPLLGPG
jgi:RNA polymerase sigma factor (sigma-70 family)